MGDCRFIPHLHTRLYKALRGILQGAITNNIDIETVAWTCVSILHLMYILRSWMGWVNPYCTVDGGIKLLSKISKLAAECYFKRRRRAECITGRCAVRTQESEPLDARTIKLNQGSCLGLVLYCIWDERHRIERQFCRRGATASEARDPEVRISGIRNAYNAYNRTQDRTRIFLVHNFAFRTSVLIPKTGI